MKLCFYFLTSLFQQQQVLSKPQPQAHSTYNHRSHDPGSNPICSSWKGLNRRLSSRPVSTGQHARGKSRQALSRTRDTGWSRLDRCRATSRKIYLWGTGGPGFHILRRELDLGNGDLSGENRGRGRRRDGLTGQGAGLVSDRNCDGLHE